MRKSVSAEERKKTRNLFLLTCSKATDRLNTFILHGICAETDHFYVHRSKGTCPNYVTQVPTYLGEAERYEALRKKLPTYLSQGIALRNATGRR